MYDAHPATNAPMRIRVDYVRVVASLAAVDSHVEAEELNSIRGLCAALALPAGATENLLSFAKAPNAERVRESLESLRDTELRLTLVTDLVALAMSDGKYDIQERKQIHALAATLLIGPDKVAAIEDFVSQSIEGSTVVTTVDVHAAARDPSLTAAGDVAGAIAAAGVPLAVVWAYSPRGLSYVGVTRALEALGFGMGPLWGVAVAMSSGLLAFVLVRLTSRLILR